MRQLESRRHRATVRDTEAYFGKIDILCNNAGPGLFDFAEKQSDEIRKTMMKVNLSSHCYFSREAGKGMIRRGYGKILFTGSIHSTAAIPELPLTAYCTRKGGIGMLTKAPATERAKYNITVNAIGPAYFPGEMTGGNHRQRRLHEGYCCTLSDGKSRS